jgi:hypothetical protein
MRFRNGRDDYLALLRGYADFPVWEAAVPGIPAANCPTERIGVRDRGLCTAHLSLRLPRGYRPAE